MKITAVLILWAVILPAMASGLIMVLWNGIIPPLFGLTTLSLWQASGLFFLGQLLTGGFIVGLMLLAMMLHGVMSRHNKASHLHEKWAQMTDEQRQDFIRRRHLRFGKRYDKDTYRRNDGDNA